MNTIQEILLRKHLQKLIEAGRKASAEILTEKLLKRLSNDTNTKRPI